MVLRMKRVIVRRTQNTLLLHHATELTAGLIDTHTRLQSPEQGKKMASAAALGGFELQGNPQLR